MDMAVRTQFTAVDKVSAAFGRMSTAADKFAARGSAAMGRLNRMTDSVLGGLRQFLPALSAVAVYEFANKSIDAFQQSEAAIANVNAGLKSTNNAIGMTSEQISKMAAQWQQVGIFEDDAILQNVSAQLLTFGNIGEKNFNRVQASILDVTAKLKGVNATGEDLKSISIMMGKAMDNPARGMAALRRIGISFSDQEERQVKAMMKSNNIIGAQTVMLKSIERQYGGTNEALKKTNKGMEIWTKNQMSDTMELIGEQLVPLKQSLLEFAAKALPAINKALPPLLKVIQKIAPILPYIVAGIVGLKGVIIVARGFSLFAKGLDKVIFFCRLWKAVGFVDSLTTLPGTVGKVTTAIKGWEFAQKALNIATKAMPWFLLISAIAFLATELPVIIENWDQWTQSQVNTMGTLGAVIGMIKALTESWQTFKDKGFIEGMGKLTYEVNKKTFQELKTKTGQDATPGFLKKYEAPNKAEAEIRNNNNVRVNLYNANPGSKVDVTPKRGAKVNMEYAGQN